jgi:hypothetical protein
MWHLGQYTDGNAKPYRSSKVYPCVDFGLNSHKQEVNIEALAPTSVIGAKAPIELNGGTTFHRCGRATGGFADV